MKALLVGLIGLIASIYLVDSLTCNKCSVGLVGFCISQTEETCAGNQSCYTGKAVFTSISSFNGFNTQGCLDTSGCNTTSTSSILGASYTVTQTCCDTDKCNPIDTSGAPPVTYVSATMALSAALLASVWSSGSMI
ncbi:sperm acrosome membrane-associated protein 4-like [Engraulis encrasicolus]|uniref:sperm acrosome membrane-associated protein 4-like n=1 Tax=Engraulis encrasicolus TaxID=184585 RepID=UPI002FD712CA